MKIAALLPYESPAIDTWRGFLLGNLKEFSTLAWYLVADGILVEETFVLTMARLDKFHSMFFATLSYKEVRTIVITEAIAVAEVTGRAEEANRNSQCGRIGKLSESPRLAFMPRMVIR